MEVLYSIYKKRKKKTHILINEANNLFRYEHNHLV